MKSHEERIRRMLDDIGRALVRAINDSSRVSGTIREIRQNGYSLHLVLGCLNEAGPGSAATSSRESVGAAPAPEGRRPTFRLNAEDVAFLKSIGIDPTRSPRRRRKPGSAA